MAMRRQAALAASELTVEMVRHILNYDPDSGLLTWRNPSANNVKPGDPAGAIQRGYVVIKYLHKKHFAHRLAWLHFYGVWPGMVDHKDRNPSNNAIINLREATPSQNQHNRVSRGYWYNKRDKKYCAQIIVNRRAIPLGRFDSAEEAIAAHRRGHARIAGEYSFVNCGADEQPNSFSGAQS